MRGVTFDFGLLSFQLGISTHTPHARRDPMASAVPDADETISTHTPHARRDFVN